MMKREGNSRFPEKPDGIIVASALRRNNPSNLVPFASLSLLVPSYESLSAILRAFKFSTDGVPGLTSALRALH